MIGIAMIKVKPKKRRTTYTSMWANRLATMVDYNLKEPHKFICFTDDPGGLDSRFSVVPLTSEDFWYSRGWWAKLQLFNPKHAGSLGDRNLYLDLDTLVFGDLSYFLEVPAEFAILPDSAPGFKKPGLVKMYNSSVMVFNRGVHPKIFTKFRPEYTKKFRGDQDWIGHLIKDAYKFDGKYVTRLSPERKPKLEQRIALCIKYKNNRAAKMAEWVDVLWRTGQLPEELK